MGERTRARVVCYLVAVAATAVALAVRWPLMPLIGYHSPFLTFFLAIVVSAYFGGLGPALAATLLSAAVGDYFLLEPHNSVALNSQFDAFSVGLFVLTGAIISVIVDSQRRLASGERRFGATLASIGDAVVATDVQTRITFLNPVAESLTGWPMADAVGRPLADAFRIVNEQTRRPVDNPAAVVLRSRTVVALADHTVLLARDGREVPIDASGAPIIDDCGDVTGVVLVFHDLTRRRSAEGPLWLNEARLHFLEQLNLMAGATLKEITDFALESAVSLTNSTLGYVAFLNEDESVLTMSSWSKAAMAECTMSDRPIVFPVVTTGLWGEAVRQRMPIITNDYLSPNPLKKGHPKGHVHLLRHMNAPIFDGDHIVLVAGVGNKDAPYDDADVWQLTLLMQKMWQLIERKRADEAAASRRNDENIKVDGAS